MNVALSEIQGHFRAKTDGELLSLASNAEDITAESRIALLEEMRGRLDAVVRDSAKIQLIHGWYTVFVQRANISFPSKCPKCLREGANTEVAIRSQTDVKHRIVYTEHQSVAVKVPYCSDCASKLKYKTRLIAWPSYLLVFGWIAVCAWLNLGKLAIFVGSTILLLPLVALSREHAAVTLGDSEKDWLEFRFRSSEYAEAFASSNNVLSQNAETIRDEFSAAIKSMKSLGC